MNPTDVTKTLESAQSVQQVEALVIVALSLVVVVLARYFWSAIQDRLASEKAMREEIKGLLKDQIDVMRALKDGANDQGH